jgi:hypothetical protein
VFGLSVKTNFDCRRPNHWPNGCTCPPKKLGIRNLAVSRDASSAAQLPLGFTETSPKALTPLERKRLKAKLSTRYIVRCHRCGVEVGLFYIRTREWAKKLWVKELWRDHVCVGISKYSLTLENWEVDGWKLVQVSSFAEADQKFLELKSVLPSLNCKILLERSSPQWLDSQCIAKPIAGTDGLVLIDGIDNKNRQIDQTIIGLIV